MNTEYYIRDGRLTYNGRPVLRMGERDGLPKRILKLMTEEPVCPKVIAAKLNANKDFVRDRLNSMAKRKIVVKHGEGVGSTFSLRRD
jgi:hypothetical protein